MLDNKIKNKCRLPEVNDGLLACVVVNQKAFQKAIDEALYQKKPFASLSSDNYGAPAFITHPLAGYDKHEGAPDCCEMVQSIFKFALDDFAVFPNCCIPHKKLSHVDWFKKVDFIYVPLKVTECVLYTFDCIERNASKPDWEKIITDYIDYTRLSFGSLPTYTGAAVGLQKYLALVKGNLSTIQDLSDFQQRKIEDFIEDYDKPERTAPFSPTDLNILYHTYQRWLSIFPFWLKTYFGDLLFHFEKHLPFLQGKPEENMFLPGIAKAKFTSKEQLIEHLIKLTNELLLNINSQYMYDNGLITDVKKMRLDIAMAKRKVELSAGYLNDSPDEERRYRRMVKDWLAQEKKFFKEIEDVYELPQQDVDVISMNGEKEVINNMIIAEEFIKEELLGLFEKKEKQLEPIMSTWGKINYAAWANYLYEQKYFKKELVKGGLFPRKTLSEFTKYRYKQEVIKQFETAQSASLKSNTGKLAKFFGRMAV